MYCATKTIVTIASAQRRVLNAPDMGDDDETGVEGLLP